MLQVCGFHVYAHDFTRQVGGSRLLHGMFDCLCRLDFVSAVAAVRLESQVPSLMAHLLPAG